MNEEQAKIQSYKHLAVQIREIYQTAAKVFPFLVNALGTIFRDLSALQDTFGISDIIESMQVTVLLGTIS